MLQPWCFIFQHIVQVRSNIILSHQIPMRNQSFGSGHWLGQQPALFFASGIQNLVDRWNKCLNELGQCVETWNISAITLTC